MNFGDNDKILTQIDVIFTKRKIYIHLQHLGNNNMLFAEKKNQKYAIFQENGWNDLHSVQKCI